MVKCDEVHNLVVVVPGESDSSRIFWTSAGQNGFSPLVCRMVQKIGARGGSLLPLGMHEQDILKEVLVRLPEELGEKGLLVVEKSGTKGIEVTIFSFCGNRFNRLLALLLKEHLGGSVQVRYNDFIVRVLRAGKEGTGQRVFEVLRKIQKMSMDEIGSVLPIPQISGWKFARAMPAEFLSDLSLCEDYHAEEFIDTIRDLTVNVR